jgi:hypothetical protein
MEVLNFSLFYFENFNKCFSVTNISIEGAYINTISALYFECFKSFDSCANCINGGVENNDKWQKKNVIKITILSERFLDRALFLNAVAANAAKSFSVDAKI